jgi:hypothetical protein
MGGNYTRWLLFGLFLLERWGLAGKGCFFYYFGLVYDGLVD